MSLVRTCTFSLVALRFVCMSNTGYNTSGLMSGPREAWVALQCPGEDPLVYS